MVWLWQVEQITCLEKSSLSQFLLRQQNMPFKLLQVKNILRSSSIFLKIILGGATISGGACSSKRIADKSASITMPASGSVTLNGGSSQQQGTVSMFSNFILNAPIVTLSPSISPTSTPAPSTTVPTIVPSLQPVVGPQPTFIPTVPQPTQPPTGLFVV